MGALGTALVIDCIAIYLGAGMDTKDHSRGARKANHYRRIKATLPTLRFLREHKLLMAYTSRHSAKYPPPTIFRDHALEAKAKGMNKGVRNIFHPLAPVTPAWLR